MSLPLDLGDQLVDRTKSSLYLYYLARATHRVMQREISRKKVELSIKQLKKLSTKDLHGHIEQLQGHIQEAIHREKQIQAHQEGEESIHGELTHKITRLETKLGRYLQTQEARKKRVEELEEKIRNKFETKREKTQNLREDLKRLLKLYKEAKKHKTSKQQLLRLAQRMDQVRNKISLLK
jgi:DNA repair exonuclease SbcCD ATPase subunit